MNLIIRYLKKFIQKQLLDIITPTIKKRLFNGLQRYTITSKN